eukprot:GHVL01034691.1.p1 GENE.GHVL01034691.1~~GHVL01034691.1.p1  ORF type:complete len:162 (+),score=25.71 GHVL01034691.1:458-943(+)
MTSLVSAMQSSEMAKYQRQLKRNSYFVPKKEHMNPVRYRGKTITEETKNNLEETDNLETENAALMQMYSEDTSIIQQTQDKLREISKMMGMFATKVVEQEDLAIQLTANMDDTIGNFERADEQIHKAMESSMTSRTWTLIFLIFSGIFLLLLDWIKSTRYI